MKSNKKYKLEIPRNQFDRIANAFETVVFNIDCFNAKKDTIIFTVSEKQRKSFEKYAIKKDNPKIPSRLRATYWITQMFLPRNITKWEIEDENEVVNN